MALQAGDSCSAGASYSEQYIVCPANMICLVSHQEKYVIVGVNETTFKDQYQCHCRLAYGFEGLRCDTFTATAVFGCAFRIIVVLLLSYLICSFIQTCRGIYLEGSAFKIKRRKNNYKGRRNRTRTFMILASGVLCCLANLALAIGDIFAYADLSMFMATHRSHFTFFQLMTVMICGGGILSQWYSPASCFQLSA